VPKGILQTNENSYIIRGKMVKNNKDTTEIERKNTDQQRESEKVSEIA
jgi:hypothetical protein